jgi:hypothetical protein
MDVKVRSEEVTVSFSGFRDFIAYGQAASQKYYSQILANLRKRVRRVRPQLLLDALTHSAHTKEFLAKESLIALEHLAFSSELSPFDICLFPIMKNQFMGSYYEVAEKIQKDMVAILNCLQEDDFQKCFDPWREIWNICADVGEKYIGGEHCS